MILSQEILYKDITDELIKMATPNDNPIPEISRYLKYNLKNASFDMKDITNIERITLKQIQNKIGGQFMNWSGQLLHGHTAVNLICKRMGVGKITVEVAKANAETVFEKYSVVYG